MSDRRSVEHRRLSTVRSSCPLARTIRGAGLPSVDLRPGLLTWIQQRREEQVWQLRTLLPDLPGESVVPPSDSPALRGPWKMVSVPKIDRAKVYTPEIVSHVFNRYTGEGL